MNGSGFLIFFEISLVNSKYNLPILNFALKMYALKFSQLMKSPHKQGEIYKHRRILHLRQHTIRPKVAEIRHNKFKWKKMFVLFNEKCK